MATNRCCFNVYFLTKSPPRLLELGSGRASGVEEIRLNCLEAGRAQLDRDLTESSTNGLMAMILRPSGATFFIDQTITAAAEVLLDIALVLWCVRHQRSHRLSDLRYLEGR